MAADRRQGRGAGPHRAGHLGATLLLFTVSLGTLLLVGSPAVAQTGDTGVPPVDTYVIPVGVPPIDTYVVPVGTYVRGGLSSPAGVALSPPPRQGSAGAVISVGTEGLDAPSDRPFDGRGDLVTGWDLITIAAVGLTAAVGFAVSTGRFRSR